MLLKNKLFFISGRDLNRSSKLRLFTGEHAALIQRLIQKIQELEEDLDELLANEEQVEIEFEFDSGFVEDFHLLVAGGWY